MVQAPTPCEPRPSFHIFLYRACFNFCLCSFYWYFQIHYFTLMVFSTAPILWVCSFMMLNGYKATHAILLWHIYSAFLLVMMVMLSGGASSEWMPIVTLLLVSGFNIDDQRVGTVTAYFLVVLYCGVLLVPDNWDVVGKDFQYRDALRVLIFVFAMLGHSAFHQNLSTKLRRRTEHELRKAVERTTVLVDTVLTLGAPLSAMSHATDLMTREEAAITQKKKAKQLNFMVARAFSVPLAILSFYYFDKIALVYIGCGVYTIMLVSLYLYWIGSARMASIVFHLCVYIGIQAAMAITGGVNSVIVALVPFNVVAIFHGLGYQAGFYSANFAIAWYCVLFFCPSSWNVLSSSSESQLNGYRVFFFTHCMLGIISLNVNLRKFFNHHVRKFEMHLMDLGVRLGLPITPPPSRPLKVTPRLKRFTPTRLMCMTCRQERWHTFQPTVVRTHCYGPAFAYMCTRCKSKSVAEMFPEVSGSPPPPPTEYCPSTRHSSPAVPASQESEPLIPPDSLMRRSPHSGPVPPTFQSKEEVKDQLLKLLQASDAWMDALQKPS